MEAGFLVTRPRAIPVLAYGLESTTTRLMLVLPIVTSMTPGAIRLECRELPRNLLCVGGMTVRTKLYAAMILRLIWQRRVNIVCGRPGDCGMTDVALDRRIKMVRALPRRRDTIVTARARTQHLGVIDLVYR